jgi:hypothetical protein
MAVEGKGIYKLLKMKNTLIIHSRIFFFLFSIESDAKIETYTPQDPF